MDGYRKRNGQIPAFGDWDYTNELPITQYFECARQDGLIGFSSSAGKSKPCVYGHLYTTVDFNTKHSRKHVPVRKVSRVKDKRERGSSGGGGGGPLVTEKKMAGRVCDVTEPPRKYQYNHHRHPHHYHVPVSNNIKNDNSSKQAGNDVVPPKRLPDTIPKPVDEDLYKIPPEVLHSSKRKKMPGFFSCLVPACAS